MKGLGASCFASGQGAQTMVQCIAVSLSTRYSWYNPQDSRRSEYGRHHATALHSSPPEAFNPTPYSAEYQQTTAHLSSQSSESVLAAQEMQGCIPSPKSGGSGPWDIRTESQSVLALGQAMTKGPRSKPKL